MIIPFFVTPSIPFPQSLQIKLRVLRVVLLGLGIRMAEFPMIPL